MRQARGRIRSALPVAAAVKPTLEQMGKKLTEKIQPAVQEIYLAVLGSSPKIRSKGFNVKP